MTNECDAWAVAEKLGLHVGPWNVAPEVPSWYAANKRDWNEEGLLVEIRHSAALAIGMLAAKMTGAPPPKEQVMKITVTANAKMQTLALTIDGEQWANLTEAEARMLRFELRAGIEDLEQSRVHPSREEENV